MTNSEKIYVKPSVESIPLLISKEKEEMILDSKFYLLLNKSSPELPKIKHFPLECLQKRSGIVGKLSGKFSDFLGKISNSY